MPSGYAISGRVALLWFTHIHMQDRLDKSHSALAEAQLKIEEAIGWSTRIFHLLPICVTVFNLNASESK